jgi:hypothetical protein
VSWAQRPEAIPVPAGHNERNGIAEGPGSLTERRNGFGGRVQVEASRAYSGVRGAAMARAKRGDTMTVTDALSGVSKTLPGARRYAALYCSAYSPLFYCLSVITVITVKALGALKIFHDAYFRKREAVSL